MPNYLIPSGRLLSTGDFLDVAVKRIMSSGFVAIADNAPLARVYQALVAHEIHALLVADSKSGRPLGWATAKGLLAHADSDPELASARDAITEQPHPIGVRETIRVAIERLSELDTTHLVVVDDGNDFPVGVVSALDVAAFLGHPD